MKKLSNSELNRISGFRLKSYEEYLAARTLFHNGHLEQAVSLSNTCIEKQLKAILIGTGIHFKWTHETTSLLDKLKPIIPNTCSKINRAYLERVFQLYELRYLDKEQNTGKINYFISRNFYLVELDYTVSELCKTIAVFKQGESAKNMYDSYLEQKDPIFLNNNYLALEIDKFKIFDGQDDVIATVILPNSEIYSCRVTGPTNQFYNSFIGDGIKVQSNRLEVITPP